MSNFQIHELSTGALDRDSNLVHDTEVSTDVWNTRKATAGAVAFLALGVVASEYDDTASYAIGSYCIYSGVLYRCTSATTGTFDVSDWTAVLITGEYKRVRVMHKADFDLLTPEEQADGMIFVDDVDITASDISYDNTSSGLTADDIQEAVDEVVANLATVSAKTNNLFKILDFNSESHNVNAGATWYCSTSDTGFNIPTGYTLAATLSVRTSNDNFYIRYFHPNSYVVVKNTASSAQATSIGITALFVKSEFVSS